MSAEVYRDDTSGAQAPTPELTYSEDREWFWCSIPSTGEYPPGYVLGPYRVSKAIKISD